ncbi:MAG: hypothetical protein ACE5HT_09370 [Gemmatimonadales bacterium]
MSPAQWARLRKDVDCGLRRGAWYLTLGRERSAIVIEVAGRRRLFPRSLFEIASITPSQWTIVSHAGNQHLLPARWSKGYAVCPCCKSRQLILGHPTTMRCERCEERFEIAWDERYLSTN